MAVNKVVLGDETLIDLSNDTVSVDNLLAGIIAHAANGEEIIGELDLGEYIKPEGNLTGALLRRESDSGNHKLIIPQGYYVASDISTAEWRSGKTSGSGTSGGTYNISKAAMGWVPSQAAIIVDVDVGSLSANTVIAYYSTASTARCIYIASSSLSSNSYVLKTATTKATFNDNGVTFPAISGVKYLKGNYRWLVLR